MSSRGYRVFVVDDERVIASTVATILRMSGYSAEAFTSPAEALQAAAVCAPDLLLSDVMMPEMSGFDLAVRLKAACPACKVLFFSGAAATLNLLHEAGDREQNFQILQKPVHPQDLLAAIRNRCAEPKLSVDGWFAGGAGLPAAVHP
jgi:CheY-like chemotaxis protein